MSRRGRIENAVLREDDLSVAPPFFSHNNSAANGSSRARKISQAFFTAAPLRSVPQEAAVAEVFGTLSVRVAITRTRSGRHAELARRDQRDIRVNALAHLGAAVIHLRGAILIDQHQRAGLIEMRGGEGNAELHRRDREPAFAIRMLRIPSAQFVAPPNEFTRLRQFAARCAAMRLSSISWP